MLRVFNKDEIPINDFDRKTKSNIYTATNNDIPTSDTGFYSSMSRPNSATESLQGSAARQNTSNSEVLSNDYDIINRNGSSSLASIKDGNIYDKSDNYDHVNMTQNSNEGLYDKANVLISENNLCSFSKHDAPLYSHPNRDSHCSSTDTDINPYVDEAVTKGMASEKFYRSTSSLVDDSMHDMVEHATQWADQDMYM